MGIAGAYPSRRRRAMSSSLGLVVRDSRARLVELEPQAPGHAADEGYLKTPGHLATQRWTGEPVTGDPVSRLT